MSARYGRPVPPEPLVPVVPVPALVPMLEPGRVRAEVSLAALVSVPARLRDALSLIVPVPVVPEPLVPVGAVPDMEPDAPMDESVAVVPAVPAPDVPTSPALVPAVLSRLLAVQAPTATSAASASVLLAIVVLLMRPSP